jgi:hypothetical protein
MLGVKQKIKNYSLKSTWFAGLVLTLLMAASMSSVAFAQPNQSPAPAGNGPIISTGPAGGASNPSSSSTKNCGGGLIPDKNNNCVCPQGTTTAKDSKSCEDAAITCSKSNCDLVNKYLNPIIEAMAAIFGTIAVISIIVGGIQYSSSQGDPQKVSNAKKRIINTIIAIFAFLFLYSFLQFLIPGGIFNR